MNLHDYIRRQKKPLTLSEVARRCGVTRQQVHLWVTGRQRPAVKHQMTIEKLTGGAVTREAWADQYAKNYDQRTLRPPNDDQ